MKHTMTEKEAVLRQQLREWMTLSEKEKEDFRQIIELKVEKEEEESK